MKKNFILTIATVVCALGCAFGLSACNLSGGDEHTHNWSQLWSADESYHWHDCNAADCPVTDNRSKPEFGEHIDMDGDGVCEVCKYIIDQSSTATDEMYLSFELIDDGSYEVDTHKTYIDDITSITIPDTYKGIPVTSIGDHALRNCKSLVSITIPDSIKKIGENSFQNCSALKSITIGKGVTSIGSNAFSGCTVLTDVYISDLAAWCNIDFLDVGGNYSHPLAYSVSVAKSEVGNLYLNGELITELDVPDGVFSIGAHAFSDVLSIKSVSMSDSVEVIGYKAFNNCVSLETINIGNGVALIGTYAFRYCTAEIVWGDEPIIEYIGESSFREYCGSSITIPYGVTYIADYAFRDCANATSITISDSVETIGNYAFYKCTSVRSITVPDSVRTLGAFAFGSCISLTDITIGSGVTSAEVTALNSCYRLAEIYNLSSRNNIKSGYEVKIHTSSDEESGLIETDDGYVFYEDDEIVYLVSYFGNETDLIVPEVCEGKAKVVKDFAFFERLDINSIELPVGFTEIGDSAFYLSGIRSITLPDGLKTIGENAFYDDIFTGIAIPDSVTSIGRKAFGRCIKLESVVLPNQLTVINADTFNGCSSLASVVIPISVTTVSNSAFSGFTGCIYYCGTDSQWSDQVNIVETGNTGLINAERYYYSETEPDLNNGGTAYDGDYWHYVDGEIIVWELEA